MKEGQARAMAMLTQLDALCDEMILEGTKSLSSEANKMLLEALRRGGWLRFVIGGKPLIVRCELMFPNHDPVLVFILQAGAATSGDVE